MFLSMETFGQVMGLLFGSFRAIKGHVFQTSYDLFSLFGSYFFIQRFESDTCLIFWV